MFVYIGVARENALFGEALNFLLVRLLAVENILMILPNPFQTPYDLRISGFTWEEEILVRGSWKEEFSGRGDEQGPVRVA